MLINNIKFKAQKSAPNSKEVDYWINTSVNPNGGEIRYHNGKSWETIQGAIKWSVLLEGYKFCVMTIDDANSNPIIPVEGDTSWIKGRRCLAKTLEDGSVAIAYLSDEDSTKYYDGTDAALDGSEGEFMVDFEETWVKCNEVDGVTSVEVSNGDNGGAYFRRVLLGATHTVNDGNNIPRALGNEQLTPWVNLTIVQAHDSAVSLGSGWDIMDYETRNKVTFLAYAKYGNRNLQAVIGLGDSSYGFVEGCTTSLGNNDGEVTSADGKICNSLLGVENYFNNVADWLGGIHQVIDGESNFFYIYDGVLVDGVPTVPYRTIDPVADPGAYEMGLITKMLLGEHADLFPIVTDDNMSRSFDTYYADGGMYYTSAIGASGVYVVDVGGIGSIPDYGAGVFGADYGPSHSHSYIGSRLLFRGKITTYDNINEFKALPSLGKVEIPT